MELKEAIALAKHHIKDVFAEEQIDELGLEEVEFDDATQNWMITIGFSRPWGTERVAGIPPRMFPSKRDYKVVKISDNNKKVLSIKNREPAAE
jgi:hypothetical protein